MLETASKYRTLTLSRKTATSFRSQNMIFKPFFLAAALAAYAAASGQTTLYNHLSLSGSSIEVTADWDGGAADAPFGTGTNFGLQAGQVFTSSLTGSLTSVEAIFDNIPATPALDGVLVQLFNLSGGAVGSLVGQAQTTGTITSLGHSAFFNNTYRNDIASSVSIPGLVAGDQYLVVMQGQGPNVGYLDMDPDSNRNVYVRDYSSFGYSPAYGLPNWTETGAAGYESGDALMRIQGAAPAPEPAPIAALFAGLTYFLRKRRRA